MNEKDWIRKKLRNTGRGCVLWPMSFVFFMVGCSVSKMYQDALETKARTHGLEEHWFEIGDTRIHYWKGGEGPPLLILHGFGGNGLRTWARQLRSLAEKRTIIVPDLIFFGQSHSDSPPSLELQSTSFLALLRHLGMQQVDVMGISYGGFVTMEMKRTAQADEMGRIIVIDSPGGHFDEEEEAAMLQRFGVTDPKDIFVPQDWRAVRRLIGLVFHRPPYMPSWVYRDVKKEIFNQNQDSHYVLLSELRGREKDFFDMDWSQVEALVVWGSEDQVFPQALGEELAATLEADFVPFEEAAHGPNMEHPKRFNQLVLEWLEAGDESSGEEASAPID